MNKNLKKLVLTLSLTVSLTAGGFSHCVFAQDNNQVDKLEQKATKPTDEEIKISNEKINSAMQEYKHDMNLINILMDGL